MNDLGSSIKYLEERGLKAELARPNRLLVSRDGDFGIEVSTDDLRYTVSCLGFVPGPAKHEFDVQFATLDDALLAVWCFYFGRPALLGDWIIPIHRRPFWSLAKVQYRLNNVIYVTHRQFEAIVEQRRTRAPEPHRWMTFANVTQFLRCDHRTDLNTCLMFRRDLEEGYVVCNRPASLERVA